MFFNFYRRKRNDKVKIQKSHVAFLATLMCVTTFAGIGSTTAYAASGEKADVYMVDFPRDGDANYDGVWGHSNLTLKNGWHTGRSNFTNLKAIGSYSGNVAYCIEPGISLKVGQTMNKYDENYFNNLAANGVISGDEIRLLLVVFYSMATVGQSRHLGGHRMKRQQTALHRLMPHSFLSGKLLSESVMRTSIM